MSLKLIVFASLFPNQMAPNHGVFVLERLRHLRQYFGVEASVVVPIPYFPKVKGFGRWSRLSEIPEREVIDGFDIFHPRHLVTPKVGMSFYPTWMDQGCRRIVSQLAREGAQIIDAHYVYPDGVAAVRLGKRFSLPVVVTSRGTDINYLPRFNRPRRLIEQTLRDADGLAAVCQALADEMVRLVPGSDVRVLRNGVDLNHFTPIPQAEARKRLGLEEDVKWIISVGQLIERKGHHLLIESIAELKRCGVPNLRALILGEGPEEESLQVLIAELGLKDWVTLVGAKKHRELADYYSAADFSVLASSREGWANVLLESMACGTPCIATRIWGTPEVITSDECGALVEDRTVPALTHALEAALNRKWDRSRVRAHAELFSWEETSKAQMAQFEEILSRPLSGLKSKSMEIS